MKKLELYYFPQCPYCQIVLSALRVTGLESKVTYYDIHDEPHRQEQLIKDTGRGTVPCLYIDGKPMHESKDIAAWIHNYSKDISHDHDGSSLSGN
jgi:glutaredoxin